MNYVVGVDIDIDIYINRISYGRGRYINIPDNNYAVVLHVIRATYDIGHSTYTWLQHVSLRNLMFGLWDTCTTHIPGCPGTSSGTQ